MVGGTVSAFLRENPTHNRGFFVSRFRFSKHLVSFTQSKQVEDIVNGLIFMHSLDMVHGDLKAASSRQAGDDNVESNLSFRQISSSTRTVERALQILD
jgi:hypothetical protein